jgi:hypothetical protein
VGCSRAGDQRAAGFNDRGGRVDRRGGIANSSCDCHKMKSKRYQEDARRAESVSACVLRDGSQVAWSQAAGAQEIASQAADADADAGWSAERAIDATGVELVVGRSWCACTGSLDISTALCCSVPLMIALLSRDLALCCSTGTGSTRRARARAARGGGGGRAPAAPRRPQRKFVCARAHTIFFYNIHRGRGAAMAARSMRTRQGHTHHTHIAYSLLSWRLFCHFGHPTVFV